MKKKAQAAMEFLMTYGWAIFIVIIAIIALAYFGILTPNKSTAERCLTAPGIRCLNHKAQPTKITLELQNNLDKDIIIRKIELIEENNCNIFTNTTEINMQESSIFILECNLIQGNLVTSDLKITYDEIQGLDNKINYGTFNSKVQ